MQARWRRIVGWLAIYAVALHIIMLGMAPIAASSADAFDPFSVICHSEPAGVGGDETPARPDLIPGHACEHCNLACAVAPPPAPDSALAGSLAPTRLLQVLHPASAPVRIAVTADPRLARGPPRVD